MPQESPNPSTNGTSRSAQQQTITRVLRQARSRIDPRDIPGFAAVLGPRHKPGLTQDDVSHLLGVSTKWYRNLELGKPLNYSPTFLRAVRRLLKLNDVEWDTIWQLVHDRKTPDAQPARAPRVGDELPASLRAFIQAQRWPTYLCDYRWDLLAYNSAALGDYPWMLHGTNVMEWALTYPEARTQLIRWEQDWAIPMIAQLRLHAEHWVGDLGMQALIKRVCADPVARGLWNAPHLPTLSHPDAASTRKLYLPRQGTREFEVTLLTMKVDDLPSCRLMTVIPMQDAPIHS
ncbi:XRE family transcriptional regulator [Streptomyces sp. NPDC006627]|uniref:MmyB family transcriptional regulator n=1 Tax=Streptomyces sp. NPDC006627 TaxID=3154679 RepID=UPI0033ADA522